MLMRTTFYLFVFATLYLLCLGKDIETTYRALKEAQAKINKEIDAFCYPGHSGTRNAFLTNQYAKYLGEYNVLVYPFCLTTNELGNRLGNFFHEVACADVSGLHFMTVHPQWDMTVAFTGNSTNSTGGAPPDEHKLAFLKALPEIIIHKHPLDRDAARNKVNEACKCTRYCWQQVTAPWVNRTDYLGHYLRGAIEAYQGTLEKNAATAVDLRTDFTNAKSGEFLPIVPDVAMQYRCGDNIGFSYMYGIMMFPGLISRMPADSKYIYVLSDHPSRAVHSPYTSRCHLILETLFGYLKEKFPAATIVVKRGGDLFLDYARLGKAKTVICSVSSYCFWPAIANLGMSYFPLTPLIAGADNMGLAPDFGPRFIWMDEPIITNMKMVRPWTQILDILTGKMALPQ